MYMKIIIQCKCKCNVAPPRPKVSGLNSLVSVTPGPGFGWLRVWMALVKLEGNWGVAGDHQKLETKPRSHQDDYQH